MRVTWGRHRRGSAPVFIVVGALSLGLCRVLEINDRNYVSQNTHYNGIENRRGDLGEDTPRVVRIHRGHKVWLSALA